MTFRSHNRTKISIYLVRIVAILLISCQHNQSNGNSIYSLSSSDVFITALKPPLLKSVRKLRSSSLQRSQNYYSSSPFLQQLASSLSSTTKNAAEQTGNHNTYRDKLQHQYESSGGILYRTSILTPQELESIRNDLFGNPKSKKNKKSPKKEKSVSTNNGQHQLALTLRDETNNSIAKKRTGAVIPNNSETARILSDPNGSLSKLVNRVANKNNDYCGGGHMVLSPHVPVEVRVYEKKGAGMDWHIDDVLFPKEPQIEIVFTLENTSDCITMWEEQSQQEVSIRRQVETEPNSILMIKAGGVLHRVSPLKSGRRVILKFVYVRCNNDENSGDDSSSLSNGMLLDGAEIHVNQFSSGNHKKHGVGNRKKTKKKKKGGRK